MAERRSRIEEALAKQLEAGCAAQVFPGASASVAYYEEASWHRLDVVSGLRTKGGVAVTSDTIYDLASLTKPWVAMTAPRLYQAGTFALDQPVVSLIPEANGLPVSQRTWHDVLSHRSGLLAWEAFYERIPDAPGSDETRAWFLAELLRRWDAKTVGKSVYSDLGYILAGIALSRATGTPLDELVTERVAVPLGLEDAVFYAASRKDSDWKSSCASAGWSPWRQRMLVGEVHDDNCAALGGVAGHAGMFGTARGVATFGAACVGAWHGRRGALEEEAIRFATEERPGGTHRLGWDGVADDSSAAGSLLDRSAFGHLGFTGTSFWCDPRRELVIVLLTNRVAISADNTAIRAYRPRFHDAVVAAFDGR